MAIQYFTDKNMEFHSREIFKTTHMPGAIQVKPADVPTVVDFTGFGVAITGSSCYLLNEMEKSHRTEFLKSIYSPSGLNLSVGRISIGASDYSAELYSYDDVPFDTELKHFSIERDEKYIIPMIKEILAIKPDLYIFASPWSPPGWMKTGGSMCGGYMRREFVECYAEYVVKFIKAYASHGIKISAITPQNEPETQQQGLMPACMWHPEIEAEYIKVLKKKLAENGLQVKVWMYDHNFDGTDRVLWMLENDKELLKNCDGVAFHYYADNIEKTVKITEQYPELELNFTEGGPRLYDNYGTDWCKWSIMISKVLACGYKSFTGWNLMLDEMGAPNIGPFFCGGLVTKNSVSGELTASGQYKALKHIAPYFEQGAKIYPVKTNECARASMFEYPKMSAPVEGFMIEAEGKNVFVLVNPGEEKKQLEISSGKDLWYAELLPDSVSTIIL